MDYKPNYHQPLVIFHRILNFTKQSLMNIGCPFCKCLSILSALLGVRASSGCLICSIFVVFCVFYEFFIQNLSVQATRKITLGDPTLCSSTKQGPTLDASSNSVSSISGPIVGPVDDVMPNDGGSTSLEGSASTTIIATQERAPKKMVSINENVEEIGASVRKWKKKKEVKKSASMDGGKEEIKPLKSILKVGSNVKENKSGGNS